MFEIDEPHVVAETIGDEVVIINLKVGTYFSICGAGAHIWTALVAGWEPRDIVSRIERANAGTAQVAGDIGRFVQILTEEGLIRVRSAPAPIKVTAGDDPFRGLQAYEAPVVEKHVDMKELLLLDPVHDVDEQGWPHIQ
jgi:hypothetical protein